MITSRPYDKSMTHALCLGCLYEVDDNLGGPDMDRGVCISCDKGDMYNDEQFTGRFIGG